MRPARTKAGRTSVLLSTLTFFGLAPCAFALDEIVHPYFDTRTAAMGGVVMTTGLYDQNFYANPARATDNPENRLTLLDVSLSASSSIPGSLGTLVSGGSQVYHNIGTDAGTDYAARLQTAFPAYYWSPGKTGKWAISAGVLMSTEVNADFRQNFNLNPNFGPDAVSDVGPALTVARRFFDDNSLSVGVTGHATYRLSGQVTFVQLIQDSSINIKDIAAQGSMYDFDLGTEYKFHWHPLGINFSAAIAVQNVLNAQYNNLNFHPLNGVPLDPTDQPRTVGAGIDASKDRIGAFTNSTVAFEVTDMGNNGEGSFYRLLHLGAETHYKLLALRGGVNQGYLCAGIGLDLKVLSIDATTYGQEMGLNTGDLQDREYALRISFHI
jgi:hypothetical protein